MSFNLAILPHRAASAAENMAADMLLLEDYPEAEHIRFRHYSWSEPKATTFGYSQKWQSVSEQCNERPLIRRPTGGGLVPHENDWTYTLVIPTQHPLYREKAINSYAILHKAIDDALQELGMQTSLAQCEGASCRKSPAHTIAAQCFQKAEVHDVIDHKKGHKVAGAAQKRNRHGLLIQGSIWKPAIPSSQLKDLHESIIAQFEKHISCKSMKVEYPQYAVDRIPIYKNLFKSTQWNQRR